ncbi:hypothetical protein DCC39_10330 [Pueribacillus theae]|uniref:Uncharacterized protein n=1 Tax=Pueribacillus theae TaxID=2171751 RepID=A0A2U1K0Q8_9BACI|nr:hypothetical protein [Pueribacillus theae]PWA11086.1 hypothetical protein DCC39_10330 [Pueribacillus theae]
MKAASGVQENHKRIVAIDPGKSNGFAFFEGEELHLSGVFMNIPEAIERMFYLIDYYSPDELVIESFRLYPWKAKQQFWSDFETPEIIGVLKHWAWNRELPVIMQPASNKQPFPDERLRKMNVYVTNGHARDAIRHGLYRVRFGK